MNFSLIPQCRGCSAGSSALTEVFKMKPMPLAGVFCKTATEAMTAPIFPLTWMECSHCGLVQVLEDIPDSVLFTAYNYSSSTVGGLVKHFDHYASLLATQYGNDKITFLEIGCNDGVLLRRLPSAWRLIGVDPSDVAKNTRDGGNYELANEPFTEELVRRLGLAGRIDVLSGSNCLAHVTDMSEVFRAAAVALREGGEFWIEVHELDALLRDAQWDTIYHEHKGEWSEAALRCCVTRCGFAWISTEKLPMHGGAIRVRFVRQQRAVPEAGIRTDFRSIERLNTAYCNRYEARAVQRLLGLQRAGRAIAAYGAAGRANVYLNQMDELKFSFIVDESPLRKGRYIPGMGTTIVGPEVLTQSSAEACLITAWNYREDIIGKNPTWRGDWLTAFGAWS